MDIRKIFLALILAATPGAQASFLNVSIVLGDLSRTQIKQSLESRDKWFRRANENCKNQSFRQCDITLRVDVPSEGGKASCSVAYSTIQEQKLIPPYCAVVESINFPASTNPTEFYIELSSPDKVHLTSPSEPIKLPSQNFSRVLLPTQSLTPATDAALMFSYEKCKETHSERNAEAIRECFHFYGRGLNLIYSAALSSKPDISVSLLLDLQIDADGSVTDLNQKIMQGTAPNAFVHAVSDFVRKMNFGKSIKKSKHQHMINFFPTE